MVSWKHYFCFDMLSVSLLSAVPLHEYDSRNMMLLAIIAIFDLIFLNEILIAAEKGRTEKERIKLISDEMQFTSFNLD